MIRLGYAVDFSMATNAAYPDHMNRFLAPKRFQSRFGWGDNRFITEVDSPDLRGLDYRMASDWGPTYTIELPLASSFLIRYSDDSGRGAEYVVSPPTVSVEAPMRAAERERFPFALAFLDAARGLRYRAFMAFDGDVEHCDVERVHVAFDVPKLLFREADRRASDSLQSA